MVIDVYKQYFAAECVYNGVQRKGALVTLTATSESGNIKYEVSLSFFPHADAEDFAVSYDAYASKVIYDQRGRRSKKREKLFMEEFRVHANALAAELGGRVFWDEPLREAIYG